MKKILKINRLNNDWVRLFYARGDIRIKTAENIFADLDKIILSGYPYKRFHPRKYNMLKKKYL